MARLPRGFYRRSRVDVWPAAPAHRIIVGVPRETLDELGWQPGRLLRISVAQTSGHTRHPALLIEAESDVLRDRRLEREARAAIEAGSFP